MNTEFLSRTRMLLGDSAIDTLQSATVAVIGVGGVGGYVVEALARSGIGTLHLVDNDTVAESNINRQIVALHSTIGRYKVDVAAERVHDISPDCRVVRHKMFYLPDNAADLPIESCDYVVDCVDTVTAKWHLIVRCHELNVPLICSMGAANKMDPTAFRVCDLFATREDPIAKALRKRLRKLGIRRQQVVCSTEVPLPPVHPVASDKGQGRFLPASNAFVPAAAGLVLASAVVRDLLQMAGTYRVGSEQEKDRTQEPTV